MTRPLKTIAVVILLLLLSPFIVISGFGFYHVLDVPNGVSMFTRGLLGNALVKLTADRVPVDELRILSKPVLWMGKLESEDLPETSGLAAFSTKPNLLFAVNDSGNPAGIYALTLDGKEAGHWPIDYPRSHDFEDLAAFSLDGKPYLLVADTGDNLHWRPQLNVLVFEAPRDSH